MPKLLSRYFACPSARQHDDDAVQLQHEYVLYSTYPSKACADRIPGSSEVRLFVTTLLKLAIAPSCEKASPLDVVGARAKCRMRHDLFVVALCRALAGCSVSLKSEGECVPPDLTPNLTLAALARRVPLFSDQTKPTDDHQPKPKGKKGALS